MNASERKKQAEALAIAREGMVIDTHDLDEECRVHANAHGEITRQHALMLSRAAEIKYKIKRLRALKTRSARSDMRSEPPPEGETRKKAPTIKDIEAFVELGEELDELQCDLLDQERLARLWDALRSASAERGHQLRHLVSLHVAGLLTPRRGVPLKSLKRHLEDPHES